MSDTAVLHKILHVKEQEKTDAQVAKQSAAEQFESLATTLYKELKRKEEAESSFSEVMCSSVTITRMKEQSLYISRLNEKIVVLQHKVQQARNKMEAKQAILTEAHIEVKKIEKLIELREEELKQVTQKQEVQLMDDISIRQFLKANTN